MSWFSWIDVERFPLPDASLSTSYRQIFWWGSDKTWLCKINLKKATVRLRLIHALSKSNNPTFSIAVLCYEKIGWPGWVTCCYLYSQKKSYTHDKFPTLLQSTQTRTWLGLCLVLRLASCAVVAIGPLTRVHMWYRYKHCCPRFTMICGL
jgi:hypothetical protein